MRLFEPGDIVCNPTFKEFVIVLCWIGKDSKDKRFDDYVILDCDGAIHEWGFHSERTAWRRVIA